MALRHHAPKFLSRDGSPREPFSGALEHVMSGVDPHGCQVFSFEAPSSEDLDHDYLWRCTNCLWLSDSLRL